MVLVENLHRDDLEPIEEAQSVADLLERPGWDLEAVADAIGGVSIAYVARRARVAKLHPKVVKMLGDEESPIFGWSISQLEVLARLDPNRQPGFLREKRHWIGGYGVRELRDAVGRELRDLAAAPWKLDDAELVPNAGACTACPKRSGACPGLFDDQELEVKTSARRKRTADLCLDGGCYAAKTKAAIEVLTTAARERYGDKLALVIGGHVGRTVTETQRDDAAGIIPAYRYETCKKTEKGARPALVVRGKGEGRIVWIRSHQRCGRPSMSM